MTDPMLDPVDENDFPLSETENTSPDPSVTPTPIEETGGHKEEKEPFVAVLLEYLEILVLSVCAVLLIFTLGVRLCRVNGNSMKNTLLHSEMLLTASLADIEAGDIIVFHQTSDVYLRFNEPLVKRVIATEGQVVRIDYTDGSVYVDGKLLEETYISLLDDDSMHEIGFLTLYPAYNFDRTTRIFEATVPEGCLFVMGDNRNNSADSRSREVGFVDERRVLGKVICRLSPYTEFD